MNDQANRAAGIKHCTWTRVTAAPAVCDVCNKRNGGGSVLQRCDSCGRQVHEACFEALCADGVHEAGSEGLDWAAGGKLKRKQGKVAVKKSKSDDARKPDDGDEATSAVDDTIKTEEESDNEDEPVWSNARLAAEVRAARRKTKEP